MNKGLQIVLLGLLFLVSGAVGYILEDILLGKEETSEVVVEQPVAEPTEPVEQAQVLTASNTNVGSAPSAPVYVDPSAMIAKNTTDHGYAVASLILGIIGLVTCCCYGVTAVVLGVIGLILGILSRKHGNNEGISLAGVIISAISLGLGLIFGAIVVVAFFAAMEDMMYENYDLFEEMYDGYIKLFRPF